MAVKKKMARKNMTETKIRPIESYEHLRPGALLRGFTLLVLARCFPSACQKEGVRHRAISV
jgi:hypothetical protein